MTYFSDRVTVLRNTI